MPSIKNLIKHIIGRPYIPATGEVNLGHLRRTTPFSLNFGYERGGPVDRYYIEKFLEAQQHLIAGRVLEIGDNEYTLRYGGSRVVQSDVLHIEDNNAKATYVGDLTDVPHMPDNHFDCIVLTQTLHLIYHFHQAVQSCFRMLKPGGVLLITVPGISQIDQGEWKNIWLWSFTETSLKRVLSDVFSVPRVVVETYGNVLVATAFLYGMGLPELTPEELNVRDPHYPVIITGVATKG